jgi:hypothetical protein
MGPIAAKVDIRMMGVFLYFLVVTPLHSDIYIIICSMMFHMEEESEIIDAKKKSFNSMHPSVVHNGNCTC